MRTDMRRNWAILCAIAILGTTAASAASDWAQFRGPNRDGKAADGPALLKTWPEGGPKQLWVNDTLGDGFTSATVTDTAIYITGMKGKEGFLYALDLDGKQIWAVSYGRDWEGGYRGSRTTPTFRAGKLYLMSGYGRATCHDAKTGREIWAVDTMAKFGARNIQWGITESPLVLDDRVIVTPGGPKAGMVALHPETGETVWVCSELGDSSGYCSPILIERGGRKIIAQLMNTTFVGIEATTGKLLWREPRQPAPAHGIQAVSPVYADGRCYVTSGYGGERGEMFQLSEDGSSAKSVWREAQLDCHHGGLVLLNGFIYGAADRNKRNQWLCLKLETGEVVAKTGAVGKGSIVFADGLLYTLGEQGMMGLVDPDTTNFRMVSSFKIPSGGSGPYWAHPSIANGRLYVRHASRLFAYDIQAH
ncbi:MAG: alcohol dehydrogenase [Lentisphaerae bacterium]|nr:alcohol dehydrogenase [Lentisphaerota bacterium]